MTPVVGGAAFGQPAGNEAPVPTKRKRRTKAQIEADNIEAAVVPADDDEISLVFTETGTPGKRPWSEAYDLWSEGSVTLSKELEFAAKKVKQASASPPDPDGIGAATEGDDHRRDAAGFIDVGALGVIGDLDDDAKAMVDRYVEEARQEGREQGFADARAQAAQNAASSGPQQTINQVDAIPDGTYKVTMGYLEKIGLPEYSSLQIGPATVSRSVVDDGRRTEVKVGDRVVSLPTAVIEAQQECAQVCEVVMRAERQSMIVFLESAKSQT